MKIGVSGQSLGQISSLGETLDFLHELGVSYLEVWPCNLPALEGGTDNDSFENRDAACAAELLNKKGIGVSAVSFSGAFVKAMAEDEQRYQKELLHAVEVARTLGAKVVNHYCYHLSLHELDVQRLKRAMTPALERAKEYGIILVLENEAHDMTKTPLQMLAVLEAMGYPNLQTNYDAVNYYQAEEEGFPYAYEILKDRIGYVHIKNGCRDPERGRFSIRYTSIEDGAVNIAALLSRLQRDGYEGYCVIEPHCPPEEVREYLKLDMNWLKKTYVRGT